MHSTSSALARPNKVSDDNVFLEDVLFGLSQNPKRLDCKYLYDHRGSQLFDEICELDEYYPTRTELSIMDDFAGEMGNAIGSGAMLVEYGSGSSLKTRDLLDSLTEPAAYVPVDISDKHLHLSADSISADYPDLEVLPCSADFTDSFDLPSPTKAASHTAVYFPGSTIGNFLPEKAEQLLYCIADLVGKGGKLLVGIDLVKQTDVLERAYNDAKGVTAAFNLNLLWRIKREVDCDLHPHNFKHHSFYNDALNRIEIYVRSLCDQTVRIGNHIFELDAGELIHTEYSHKYTIKSFSEIAARAGLTLRQSWTDDRQYFAVLLLSVD